MKIKKGIALLLALVMTLALKTALQSEPNAPQEELGRYYHDVVFNAMSRVRDIVDQLEQLVDKSYCGERQEGRISHFALASQGYCRIEEGRILMDPQGKENPVAGK